jgi:hypothetical protein
MERHKMLNELLDKIKGMMAPPEQLELSFEDAPPPPCEDDDGVDEAIGLSKCKELMQHYDKTRYNVWFKGKERVWLTPGAIDEPVVVEPAKDEVPSIVIKALAERGYEISNYKEGLCKMTKAFAEKVHQEKREKLMARDPELAKKLPAHPKIEETKINTVLTGKNPDLAAAKAFQLDPARQGVKARAKNEYVVCISRNPVDIGSMSAGRGWSSCMNIDRKSTRLNSSP